LAQTFFKHDIQGVLIHFLQLQATWPVVELPQYDPIPCKWWLEQPPELSAWRSPPVSVIRVIVLYPHTIWSS